MFFRALGHFLIPQRPGFSDLRWLQSLHLTMSFSILFIFYKIIHRRYLEPSFAMRTQQRAIEIFWIFGNIFDLPLTIRTMDNPPLPSGSPLFSPDSTLSLEETVSQIIQRSRHGIAAYSRRLPSSMRMINAKNRNSKSPTKVSSLKLSPVNHSTSSANTLIQNNLDGRRIYHSRLIKGW